MAEGGSRTGQEPKDKKEEQKPKAEEPAKVEATPAPTPDWAGEDGLSKKEQKFVDAFFQVNGRVPTQAEYSRYAGPNNHIVDNVAQHIARDYGKDPTKFGATVVDPASLGRDLKPYYDVWSSKNSDRQLTSADVQYLGWVKDAEDVKTFEAEMKGLIKHDVLFNKETGKSSFKTFVTKEALDYMGGKVGFRGNQSGRLYYVEQGGSFRDGENFQRLDGKDGTYSVGNTTFNVFGSTGNPKDFSLIEEVFGESVNEFVWKATPDELDAVVKVIPLSGDISQTLGGKEFTDDAYNGWDNFGVDAKDVGKLEAVVDTAVATFGGGLGKAAVLAGNVLGSVNRGLSGQTEWDRVLGEVAYSVGAQISGGSVIGQYAFTALGNKVLLGNDWDDSLQAANWQAAGTLTGGASNVYRGIKEEDNLMVVQGAIGMADTYQDYKSGNTIYQNLDEINPLSDNFGSASYINPMNADFWVAPSSIAAYKEGANDYSGIRSVAGGVMAVAAEPFTGAGEFLNRTTVEPMGSAYDWVSGKLKPIGKKEEK